VTSAPKKEM